MNLHEHWSKYTPSELKKQGQTSVLEYFISKKNLDPLSEGEIRTAFLVHPRDLYDVIAATRFNNITKKFISGFIHAAPKRLEKSITNFLSEELSKIPPFFMGDGEVTLGKTNVKSYLLGILLYGEQMFGNNKWRRFSREKILDALLFAYQHNIRMVGLGALTSPVTHGGEYIRSKAVMTNPTYKAISEIGITNGNALTAGVTYKAVQKLQELINLDQKETVVGILGASGSVGSALSKLLLRDKYKLVLCARNKTRLYDKFADNISSDNILLTTDLNKLKQCHIIVVATNSTEQTILPEHVSPGTIIYDLTQPKNVTPELAKRFLRKNCLVIEGGLVKHPDYHLKFNLGLGNATLACLGEVLVLGLENRLSDFCLGDPTLDQVEEILRLSVRNNFNLAPFSWNEKEIKPESFEKIKAQIPRRQFLHKM